MALYVKIKKQETIKQFLTLFFSSTFRKGYLTSLSSYTDSGFLELQCEEGRYRSFDDVFEIITTYYPGTTVVELMNELIDLKPRCIETGVLKDLYTMFCGNISKSVMLYHNHTSNDVSAQKGDSEYSWFTLFKMVKEKNSKKINDLQTVN
jgi:hypothetical protein